MPTTPASTTQNIGCPSIMTPLMIGKTKNLIFCSLISVQSKPYKGCRNFMWNCPVPKLPKHTVWIRGDFKTQPPVDRHFRPVLGGCHCLEQQKQAGTNGTAGQLAVGFWSCPFRLLQFNTQHYYMLAFCKQKQEFEQNYLNSKNNGIHKPMLLWQKIQPYKPECVTFF